MICDGFGNSSEFADNDGGNTKVLPLTAVSVCDMDFGMGVSVKVYTTTFCPYCVRAKQFLKSKGVDFEEINLSGKFDELAELKARTGWRTVPQIFIGDKFIGGYEDMAALEAEGKLDDLLK